MTTPHSRRGRLTAAASTAALLLLGASGAFAQQPAPAPAAVPAPGTPGAALPPGFSTMDKSNPSTSNQAASLSPHPVPPTVTPVDKLPLSKVKLPSGFKIELWSSGHPGARTMVMGDKGTMFMGTRAIGRVYAIVDKDGKKEVKTLLSAQSFPAGSFVQPNGLAFRDGSLYVLAINRVYRYDNIESKLDNPGTPVDLTEKFGLPPEAHHNWKYAAFGPDGKLYIQIGSNCNICETNPGIHGQIRRYNADGTGMEIVARGIRNTVGFDWHPVTKELWFTDNGRDWAGNGGPEDELNRIPKEKEGASFGFPYCHAMGIPDPDVKRPNPCAGVILPAALTGPHAAGLGIKFYTGNMFPKEYKNVAFIARHGSWNREKKYGYDVVMARVNKDNTAEIVPFMTGLLDEKANAFYGRPAYVFQMPDGALLVSDETSGAVYRISYGNQKTAAKN